MPLPKDAKVGDKYTEIRTVKGKRRKITWEKKNPFGKNKNFSWSIMNNDEC